MRLPSSIAPSLVLLSLLLTTSVGKKPKERFSESFEPCEYCHRLFKQQGPDGHLPADLHNKANQTAIELCEKYEEKAKDQCLDFAETYASAWSSDMAKGKQKTSAEYCEFVAICQPQTYHRPFYTSRGFCYKCKEVAASALITSEDVPEETFHHGLAIFMCMTLKTEGSSDQDCIDDMFEALQKNAEESPSKALKPHKTCKLFGTCDYDPQSYPSKPSAGYFHSASRAERERARKEAEKTPHGPRFSSPQPHRTFKIPEVPSPPAVTHNETARTRYATHEGKEVRPLPAKYKKPVIRKVAEPAKKEKAKKPKPEKRRKHKVEHAKKRAKEVVKKPTKTETVPLPVHEAVHQPPVLKPVAAPEVELEPVAAPTSMPIEEPTEAPEPAEISHPVPELIEAELEEPEKVIEPAEEPIEEFGYISEPVLEAEEPIEEFGYISEPALEPEEMPEESIEESVLVLHGAVEPLPEPLVAASAPEVSTFWTVGTPLWFPAQAAESMEAPDYESDEFDLEYEFFSYDYSDDFWNDMDTLDLDPIDVREVAGSREYKPSEDTQSDRPVSIQHASNDLSFQSKFGRFFPRGRGGSDEIADGSQDLHMQF